jgi:hypothetical protein
MAYELLFKSLHKKIRKIIPVTGGGGKKGIRLRKEDSICD